MKKLPALIFLTIFLYSEAKAQLYLLNDEFNNAGTLSNWQNTNIVEGWNAEQLEVFDINTTEPGNLHMMPYTCGWYNEWRGPLLFKLVTGDFVFTTNVSISNRQLTGLPASLYSLAGLMIRTPLNYPNGAYGPGGWAANQQDYVFLSIGFGDYGAPCQPNTNGPHFEVKTTDNSNSTLCVSPISSTEAQIRLARIGAAILILYRLPGQNWVVHQRYNRPDFPQTVQVGFVTYTDWVKWSSYTPQFANSHVIAPGLDPDPSSNPSQPFNPDLIANFDYARFNLPQVPVELAGLNLTNPVQVSNIQLLSFLGFDSTPCILQPSITGNPDICTGIIETYTTPFIEGVSYEWTITGGIIISGQGTNTITVLWNSGTEGTVNVLLEMP